MLFFPKKLILTSKVVFIPFPSLNVTVCSSTLGDIHFRVVYFDNFFSAAVVLRWFYGESNFWTFLQSRKWPMAIT